MTRKHFNLEVFSNANRNLAAAAFATYNDNKVSNQDL